jgi:hypothetical protein
VVGVVGVQEVQEHNIHNKHQVVEGFRSYLDQAIELAGVHDSPNRLSSRATATEAVETTGVPRQ